MIGVRELVLSNRVSVPAALTLAALLAAPATPSFGYQEIQQFSQAEAHSSNRSIVEASVFIIAQATGGTGGSGGNASVNIYGGNIYLTPQGGAGGSGGNVTRGPINSATSTGTPMELDTDRPGIDFTSFDLPDADPALCQKACLGDSGCAAWTYVHPGIQGTAARCWLKSSVPIAMPSTCCVSGINTAVQR